MNCQTVSGNNNNIKLSNLTVIQFEIASRELGSFVSMRCSDFYEWFEEQHGDLCPKQCSKFMSFCSDSYLLYIRRVSTCYHLDSKKLSYSLEVIFCETIFKAGEDKEEIPECIFPIPPSLVYLYLDEGHSMRVLKVKGFSKNFV